MVKFPVGTRVKAKYLATKLGPFGAVQYKEGAISQVLAELKDGKPVYEITYDDKTSAGENVGEERVFEKFIKELAAAAGSSSAAQAPAAAAPKKATVAKSPPKAKATAPKAEAEEAKTETPDAAVEKPVESAPVAETPVIAAKPAEAASKEKKSAGPTEATNKQRPVPHPVHPGLSKCQSEGPTHRLSSSLFLIVLGEKVDAVGKASKCLPGSS